ncbi:hypothetical protein AEP_01672 [Curvibacter sp. AEP1-3]|uniref:H-NS histone family protein n=1 Tax=Curvibacter sp. AEP1-3 TaxID=1844971 RepID=UPI000B3C9C3F|nr:H-NS histone family protein [Curvibacter sp. AEP1-3]ARV18616.1 hypothetical protein AEP_01672 [Curvibacter sp. AEP1-3]
MSKLLDLIAQKESLEAQIAEIREKEFAKAIEDVKALINQHNLTVGDVFGSNTRGIKTEAKSATKVAAKYRDPLTGNTWSGRGLAPKWLAGKNKEDYAIKQ